MGFDNMGVWVHPQLGLLCGAALTGAFLSQQNMIFEKEYHFDYMYMSFYEKKNLICY